MTVAFALVAFASSVLAHVEMQDPPPFRSKFNKLIDQSTVDFDNNAPLKPNGSEFPCKGFVQDFTTSPAGDSTATWAAGSPQTLTLFGSAIHNGGSCQLSLSYDQGKTFRVIKSIEGNCASLENKFDFTVPADAKNGKAIFAWTWFNHTGNREMYMNCAAVDITGSGTSTLDDHPEIFTANIGGDCTTTEGDDIQFPNPGSDLQVNNTGNIRPPKCSNLNSSPPPPPPADSPSPDSADPTNSGPCNHTDAAATVASQPTASTTASTTDTTSGTGSVYIIKAGDTCADIAAQQGITLSTLFKLNPAINEDCTNLVPEQVLGLRRRSRIMRDLN